MLDNIDLIGMANDTQNLEGAHSSQSRLFAVLPRLREQTGDLAGVVFLHSVQADFMLFNNRVNKLEVSAPTLLQRTCLVRGAEMLMLI